MSVAIAAVGAIAVALLILLVVGYWIFELTPFAHHREQFRDAHGRRIGSSPRLD
jgi:hypothetical protein